MPAPAAAVTGSKLPHNLDAEQAVLAAMILDGEVVEEAVAAVGEKDFFKAEHKLIYAAILELVNQRTPVDQLTLADKLDAMGKLDSIGGKAYILELAEKTFALAHWETHLGIMRNDSLLRDLIDAAVHIKGLSESSTDDADAVVEEAEKLLFDATNRRVSNSFRPLRELAIESIDLLDSIAKNKDKMFGVATGFTDLDKILGGMRGGDLVILAARPSIGKTAFALNVAVNAAKLGTTIAFFSLEMPSLQVVQRLLSSEANVNSWKMRQGYCDEADNQALIAAMNDLGNLNFSIDDSPSLSILELRTKARRQMRAVSNSQGLIVVDYLQLMQPPRNARQRDRYFEVGEISRGLKILAKELDVPVIALSQLSRGVERREDKRPMLSDLRESGSIEQDADIVLFIDRSFTDKEAMDPERPELGTANIIIGKNRNGATGEVQTAFFKEFTAFRNLYKA